MEIQTPFSLTLSLILVSLVHSSPIIHTTIVDKSSIASYTSIQEAIDSVPSGNSHWYKIHIKPGIYREKVTITQDKSFIFLEGSGASQTTITWDDHEQTDSSSTFSVFADNFIAKGITFKKGNFSPWWSFFNPNGFFFEAQGPFCQTISIFVSFSSHVNHHPLILSKSLNTVFNDDHFVFSSTFLFFSQSFSNSYNVPLSVDAEIRPAVAARVFGDKMTFQDCGFVGFQDTLWSVQGRHYYNSCYIEGAIDFIWGTGQAVFEDCAINVTSGLLPMHNGYITAQGRESSSDSDGFVFIRGKISGNGTAYLGRAYGPFSRVLFYGTAMENVVNPLGWNAWNYKGHEKNFMYAEASCSGQGANPSKRVSWARTRLDSFNLMKLSKENFIDQDRWLAKQP